MSESYGLAGFAEGLLEHVFLRTGSTDVTYRVLPTYESKSEGSHEIKVKRKFTGGELNFRGGSKGEVFDRFWRWVATQGCVYDPTELVRAAMSRMMDEEKAEQEFIDDLCAGGMTEFGKAVEKFRQERSGVLYQTIKRLEAEGWKPKTMEDWLHTLRLHTGIQDLDVTDVVLAISERNFLHELSNTQVL